VSLWPAIHFGTGFVNNVGEILSFEEITRLGETEQNGKVH
jgi:hypothetical protein